MTRTTSTLAFRRRGSSTWTEVDPDSPQAWRALGLSHPVEETMTAATLHVVPERPPVGVSTQEQYGWLLRQRRRLRQAYDYSLSLPGRMWAWAVRTFHLEAVGTTFRAAVDWVTYYAGRAAHAVGTLGGIGLGLLAVTTDTGRSILSNTVGRVLGWAGSAISWVWNTTYDLVVRLGNPGQWVGDRMIQIEVFGKSVVTKALTFYVDHIAKHLDVDGLPMQAGKTAGVWMVAGRILQFITPTPIRAMVMVAVGLWTFLASPVSQVPLVKDAADWVKGEPQTKTHIKAVDSEYKEAVTQAAHAAATAPAPPTPSNRSERRASKRAPARQR